MLELREALMLQQLRGAQVLHVLLPKVTVLALRVHGNLVLVLVLGLVLGGPLDVLHWRALQVLHVLKVHVCALLLVMVQLLLLLLLVGLV